MKLEEAWKLSPDERLCQLISNIVRLAEYKRDDLYYLEDWALEEAIDKVMHT